MYTVRDRTTQCFCSCGSSLFLNHVVSIATYWKILEVGIFSSLPLLCQIYSLTLQCNIISTAINIIVRVAVLYSSSHLCRHLLEDSWCRASSSKSGCRTSKSCSNEQWASGWDSRDSGRTSKCWTIHEQQWNRYEGRDGRVKRSSRGRKSSEVNEQRNVSCTDERRENDGLHHRLLHSVLDASVFLLHTVHP